MNFEPNSTYHIYNQGNNRQRIFFTKRHYTFFLEKMKRYLLPYCDILCYCLMPNHFHWLVYTHESACHPSSFVKPKNQSLDGEGNGYYQMNLNKSIAILLRSYTRALNKERDMSGSLFRQKTKAKSGFVEGIIALRGPKRELLYKPGAHYEMICFDYIHSNPVDAGLVFLKEDWEFSSYKEFKGLTNNKICNWEMVKKLELFQ